MRNFYVKATLYQLLQLFIITDCTITTTNELIMQFWYAIMYCI